VDHYSFFIEEKSEKKVQGKFQEGEAAEGIAAVLEGEGAADDIVREGILLARESPSSVPGR